MYNNITYQLLSYVKCKMYEKYIALIENITLIPQNTKLHNTNVTRN